jgi:dolichol-phosphate mannosyltransferase
VVDIAVFWFICVLFKTSLPALFIILATIASRVTSSMVNYWLNRKTVFKSKSKKTMQKYYILASVQMILSMLGVKYLYSLFNTGEVLFKLLVDGLLFFGSYKIQMNWVFKNPSQK